MHSIKPPLSKPPLCTAGNASRGTSALASSLLWIVMVCGLGLVSAERSTAEEPAKRFIDQLRAAGHYDLAIEYIDRLDSYPGVAAEFLQAVDLERAQTLLEASQRSRVADTRDEYYRDATTALERFVTGQPNHPRRPEAQLQLGNLQLLRGAQLMEQGGPPDAQRRATALEIFAGAAATFGDIVSELRSTLQELQGQKIDAAKEPGKIALRDGYRKDYLQALLLGGDAMKRAGDTFAQPGDEQRKWYNDSLARFEDLRDKYSDTLAGILATLYAAQVHQALGDEPQATDRYLAVLDQPDSDPLRIPKARAIVGLMRMLLAKSPPQYKAAIDRGQMWADDIRPNEKDIPEFQELRLVLADAHLGQRELTENGAEKRQHASAARALLLPLSRSAGQYQDPAMERLAKLGVGQDASVATLELKDLPTTFEDALKLSREILDEEKNLALTAQLIERRQQEGEALQAEQETARADLAQVRERGVEVLRHTLALANAESEAADVIQARYWLAFMLFRSERFWEAGVVGEFVARRYPGSELALSSGLTALSAWQLALRDTPADQLDQILPQLQRVAEYLVQQWPQDPQAASARELLVRIAIGRSDLESAQEFFANLPAEHPARGELQQAIGRLMWNQAVRLQRDGDITAATAVRQQMATTLTTGLATLERGQVNADVLRTAMLLARVQLLNEDTAAALQTLENDVYGPLKRVQDVKLEDPNLKADIYASALQALVTQLTDSNSDGDALMSRAGTVMEGLQQAYEGQTDGEQKLVQTFFRLARDIREQLESAPAAQQEKLTAAFKLFLDQLAAKSDDPKTLHWAAQTLVGLAEGQMQPTETRARGPAGELVSAALAILQRMETKATEQPNWLGSDKMLTQIRLELGKSARLAGDYKVALDSLSTVLAENQMLLDAQIEAALVYEQWAATLPQKFATVSYNRAINGAKPDPKTRRNTIWGWGSIAKRTLGNEQFEETFFDARYHLALCRYLQGKKEADPAQSKKLIEQSRDDIRNVFVRYPELGGGATKQRYDALLKEIQKSLGDAATGLAAL
ncbi:hypothetical protein SH139x_000899 [Planctomycetaceae bacterium SH139]